MGNSSEKYTLPEAEIGDRVRIREPKDMGQGLVTGIEEGAYFIHLERPYKGAMNKTLRVIRRYRSEFIKLSPI